MAEPRRHACPICARDAAPRAQNPFFPFCSQPCKLVDLGKWLEGTYRIPGGPAIPGEEPDTPREASREGAPRDGEEDDE